VKKLFLAFVISFAFSQQLLAGGTVDFETYQPQGIDLTARYQEFLKQPPQISNELKNVKVIMVQGIMGDYINFMKNLIMKYFGEYNYFEDQQKYLKSQGIEFEMIKIGTENSIAKNSKVVEKHILASKKPVLLLTHSKGGMDALSALVDNPDLVGRIVGMIAIQSPYLGTPVADFLNNTQPWKALSAFCLMLLGGSNESLKDLRTDRRATWYEQNIEKIREIQRRVPILSFTSWKTDDPQRKDTMFEFSRNLMIKHNKAENDGLVPWKSGVLPGGAFVAVDGLDHGATVTTQKLIPFDRFRFTQALVALFLEVKHTYY
jgi:triacylglycerol esterase/lipase EstA (alpha/beta hydrolase family)